MPALPENISQMNNVQMKIAIDITEEEDIAALTLTYGSMRRHRQYLYTPPILIPALVKANYGFRKCNKKTKRRDTAFNYRNILILIILNEKAHVLSNKLA